MYRVIACPVPIDSALRIVVSRRAAYVFDIVYYSVLVIVCCSDL